VEDAFDDLESHRLEGEPLLDELHLCLPIVCSQTRRGEAPELSVVHLFGFLLLNMVLIKSLLEILPQLRRLRISQAVAIIPGISRSGATIFTGVKLGIDKKKVAEFSFLLSIHRSCVI